ncbi:MAG: hypothetical protein RLZZ292_3671 [Bacteroidota bacterium]|jgi:hypothetical protein
MKTKIIFFFCCFLSIFSLVFGQKKLEYGVKLGVYKGANAEHTPELFDVFFSSGSFSILASSLEEAPKAFGGVTLATRYNSKGNQWRTGVDFYNFQYTISTTILVSIPTSGGTTNRATTQNATTQNNIVQIPIGYSKNFKGFCYYLGTGLTFFSIKDNATESEQQRYAAEHRLFLESITNRFRKKYPFYEANIGWRLKHTALELGYRGTGRLLKSTYKEGNPINSVLGGRGIYYLNAIFFL